METKSLYTLLGVRPDASSDQIERAYAELLHQLKDGVDAHPGGDDRIRLIAAKEAYAVLSDPIARQRYNQKLFAPQTVGAVPEIIVESSSSWGIVKLLVVGAIVIAAIWTYNRNTLEKEKLLIEHEKQIIETQVKLEQEQRELQAANQLAQQQQREQYEAQAQERRLREQALRDSRDLDYRLQRNEREQLSQQQREAREKQQAARELQYQQQQEEARQRQQRLEAERQIEREKQALRNLQNENRSSNRYY
jgi:curved DNA-binding protein CbpA